LQESYTHGSARHVSGKECEELVRNTMALFPNLPAANLVQEIVTLAEPDFLAELDQTLRSRYFIRTVKRLRERDRSDESAAAWLFPEIREIAIKLPDLVPVGDGEKVERSKLHYEDLERYLKVLNQKDRERHQKRIAAVKALMELWPPRTKKLQGLTLAEIDANKARIAGLV
jgi:hypothetical protein